MIMRLGFALVTALDPGVLLVDEGFGTGDLRFTERAAERVDAFLGRSPIIVLASHSDAMIKSMCNKAALLHEGQLVAVGPVDDIYKRYQAMAHGHARHPAVAAVDSTRERPVYSEGSIRDVGLADRLRRASGAVRITKAVAHDASGKSRWAYEPGETITFCFEYEVLEPVPSLALGLGVYGPLTENYTGGRLVVTKIVEVVSAEALEAGQTGAVELVLLRLALMPNRLGLFAWLGSADRSESYYDVIDANVDLPPLTIGAVTKDWEFDGIISIEHELMKMEVGETSHHAGHRIERPNEKLAPCG
jgi:Wzt C-terminal domain